MSTFAEKVIDFDITIEHELIDADDGPLTAAHKQKAKAATGHLEHSIDRIGMDLVSTQSTLHPSLNHLATSSLHALFR